MTIQEIQKQIEPALRLIAEMESEVQQQSAIKKLIASVEEQIKFAKSPFYQMGKQIMEDRKNGGI